MEKEPLGLQIVASGRKAQNVKLEGAGVVSGAAAQLQNTPISKASQALYG